MSAMLEHIGHAIKARQPRDLSDVLRATDEVLGEFRASNPHATIVFVSGAINADGPEYRERNVQNLLATTRRLQREEPQHAFFCSEMIFDNELRAMIDPSGPTYEAIVAHWPQVLTLPARHIQRIIFLEGYKRSQGARAEHEAAVTYGIERRYLPN